MVVARQPSFPFFKLLLSQIPAQPLHLPAPPPPSPLAKFQGFEEVSGSLATSPQSAPRSQTPARKQ